MSEKMMLDSTRGRIHWLHAAVLRVTDDLTEDAFTWRPGLQAPPIGWHLWHISRWADRVQATFPVEGDGARRQIWEAEALARSWEMDITALGPLQTGEGMDHEAAARLPGEIGQTAIMSYARCCFATFNKRMDDLTLDDVAWVRPNSQPYKVTEDKRVVPAPAAETPLFAELTFHSAHAARHLGMIEALRGVQEMHGTASA